MLITIYGPAFEIFSLFERNFPIFVIFRKARRAERLCETIAYFGNGHSTERLPASETASFGRNLMPRKVHQPDPDRIHFPDELNLRRLCMRKKRKAPAAAHLDG